MFHGKRRKGEAPPRAAGTFTQVNGTSEQATRAAPTDIWDRRRPQALLAPLLSAGLRGQEVASRGLAIERATP
jgi:hypothetical protein